MYRCRICEAELNPDDIQGTASKLLLGHIICPECGFWNNVPWSYGDRWSEAEIAYPHTIVMFEDDKELEITDEMEDLKGALEVVGPDNHQWIERNILPYIKGFYPFHARELCEFFGIELSELQTWLWLSHMPDNHIGKIRRRVEDNLRKGTPWQIIQVADLLGVRTTVE